MPREAPVSQSAVDQTITQNGDQPDAAASPRSDPVRSARWLTLLVCFTACVVLRIAHLASKPFWFDECFSVELARIDWRNFLHLVWWREANMTLYYLVLRGWLHLVPVPGQSEFFIRSLSVLFAAATLPAIYWLARLLYDRRVALIAASLFAANAYSVRYAQEARSYSLFLLLATLSSAFFVAWLRRPSRGNRIGYVLASVLAAYAHLYTLLLLVAHWIVWRWPGRPDLGPGENKDQLAAQISRAWRIIALTVLPLVVFVIKTGTGPIHWITRPHLRDLFEFFEHLAGSDSWPLAAIYALACVAALGRSGVMLWLHDESWQAWRARFLLTWLIFPIALTALLSQAKPVFLGRYMIFCLPPLIILAAAGMVRLRQSWMLAVALTVMLFLSLRGVSFVYGHDFDDERDGSQAASKFILDHAQPGDGIVFHIAGGRVPYEFFRSVRAGEDTANPAFTRALGPEILFPNHGQGLQSSDFNGKPTDNLLRGVAASHSRVWLFLIDNGPPGKPDPTTVMLTQTAPTLWPHTETWQFPRVEVRLYSRQ